ncbi:SipW-dependent-type signal peptide-containing protein [Microbacterium luticocti]|uniref:SipW-dependent-type signal peptide-containing protein n=1 Tax=Microbacterium luticocti TaxID=451764 RepID=UPI00042857FE|nr:SipW-dependent-type signal peptide-containing protein [Microbacterium luticocti]
MVTRTTRRKILAVLAGGLVLGVGTAVTLAAWNDSEFAKGVFTAGSFNLQGATDGAGGTYTDHASSNGAAALSFQLPATAAAMSPGDVVTAPFWVRLDATTTNGATLEAAGVQPGTGSDAAHLSYEVRALGPTDTCDADAAGPVVASGATLDAIEGGTPVTLTAGTGGAAGTPVQLCFIVTADAALTQGTTSTETWQFTATSTAN